MLNVRTMLLVGVTAISVAVSSRGFAQDMTDDMFVTIDEFERYWPTTRPAIPEPMRPPLSTEKNVDTGRPFLEWQRATDDWFGLRPWLDDHGVTFQANLTFDASRNFRGGADTTESALRHLLNASITLDTKRLAGWEGGTLFLNFQNQHGDNGSDLYGDAQGFSNIDADGRTQISELFFEQALWDGRLRVKAGKVDANSEFAYVENGTEFLNASMGFSPTIQGLPTYPDPATSINVFVNPTDWFYVAGGMYDGAVQEGVPTGERGPKTFLGDPGDLFLIGEIGATWALRSTTLPGHLAAGIWRHTGTFDRFSGGTDSGTAGFYVTFDQTLWREDPAKEEDEQGIGMFLQYGYADPDVSRFEHHVGAGLVWTGPIPGRDDDVAGLGATFVSFSDETSAGSEEDHELVVELFYRFQALKWLTIKPDLQYIRNPGGTGDAEDAIVGSVRVQMEF